MWLAQKRPANPDNAGAGAYPYMELMGLVSLGLDVAPDGGGFGTGASRQRFDRGFHEAKLATRLSTPLASSAVGRRFAARSRPAPKP